MVMLCVAATAACAPAPAIAHKARASSVIFITSISIKSVRSDRSAGLPALHDFQDRRLERFGALPSTRTTSGRCDRGDPESGLPQNRRRGCAPSRSLPDYVPDAPCSCGSPPPELSREPIPAKFLHRSWKPVSSYFRLMIHDHDLAWCAV